MKTMQYDLTPIEAEALLAVKNFILHTKLNWKILSPEYNLSNEIYFNWTQIQYADIPLFQLPFL